MCAGIKSTMRVDIDRKVVLPTMNKLSTMLLQVLLTTCSVWVLPVNINPEQVVDFLNFYVCTNVLFITDSETITF